MDLGEVLGVYEPNEGLREAFLRHFPMPVFHTLEELLASDAEGVIVCSATCDHADQMVAIAGAGKHIFTEKVLALTDGDCERVAAAVADSGVTFVISLFQKSVPSRRAVKAICDSGELGKINYVRFRNCHSGSVDNWLPPHFYNARECGGGAMIDLGAHGMYLIDWILGTPDTAVSAFTRACSNPDAVAKNADGVEDNAVTVMTYENGAIAVNETGFDSRLDPEVLEIHGELGRVRMEGGRVIRCTRATEGKEVEVELPEGDPLPIVQFLTGDIREGYGMAEAQALTHMMVLAYGG